MSDIEAARFAGFFDGEGTLILRGQRSPRLQIVNTVRAELAWCQRMVGVGSIYPERRARPTRRKLWLWRAERTADVLHILMQVLPHLITKRKLAERAIRIWLPRLEIAA